MALMKFGGRSLTAIFQNASSKMSFGHSQPSLRMFRTSKAKLEKDLRDYTDVDMLSKVALVVDGKYKTLAEVPNSLPYRIITKSRDRFRIRVSIGSGVFITVLAIYLIITSRRERDEVIYQKMNAS